MITSSRPGEWDSLLPAITGSVRHELSRLEPCVDCGALRRVSPHPHAPHWRGSRRVDCAEREVAP